MCLQAVMDRYHLRTKTEAVDLALRHFRRSAHVTRGGVGHEGF